jgi:alpha-glucosidase
MSVGEAIMCKRSVLIFGLLFVLSVLNQGVAAGEPLLVSSPDGKLTISLALKANPQPYLPGQRAYYRVTYGSTPILDDSPLGLDFLGANALDQDFEIVGKDREKHDSTWENHFGAQRIVPDKYNQLTVSLRERRAPGRRLDVIFRAYNEGVAFRYFLPKQAAIGKFALASENTGFHFAHDATAYALNMGRFNTHNEGEYLPIKLTDIKPVSIINLPLLVQVPGGPWVALLEADLNDYAGMYVGGVAGMPNALVSKLSDAPRKRDLQDTLTTAEYTKWQQPVLGATPKATPWRVLMMAPTPGRLIETSYLLLNLNPPCAVADTSWIKPGKAAWDWWVGGYAANVDFKPGMNTATMKHYIDFAAAHHLEDLMIDAGWYSGTPEMPEGDITKLNPDVDVPGIVDYARQKGVKVLLWVDFRPLNKQIDEAFALYEKWGVAGIKVDSMNRDDQEMVNFYQLWVRKAAEHHLTMDLHGAYKGTGLRRTYPNLLNREAVMGMEYSKWSARVTPEYDVTLPFTRMLAGPMDYTPGGFRNTARGQFKINDPLPNTQGTRAHQLAAYVVYEAPLVMVSDYPEAYQDGVGIEFIEKVPTVWDATKVLSGEVAKYIVTARQKGDNWYLGGMTNWDPRDLKIPLSFLGSGEYEAQIFADGADADKVATSASVTKKHVTSGEKLAVHLAPGGGVAIIFAPAGR